LAVFLEIQKLVESSHIFLETFYSQYPIWIHDSTIYKPLFWQFTTSQPHLDG